MSSNNKSAKSSNNKKSLARDTSAEDRKQALNLLNLANGCDGAVSNYEHAFWEAHLQTAMAELLDSGRPDIIDTLLDAVLSGGDSAEELASMIADNIEAVSESLVWGDETINCRTMLIALPIIAWTRYKIPSGALPEESCAELTALLQKHVLAPNVRCDLVPYLYSLDSIPLTHQEVRDFTKEITECFENGEILDLRTEAAEAEIELPVDARYVLGAIRFNNGAPFFRWQQPSDNMPNQIINSCTTTWIADSRKAFAKILTGAEFVPILPNSFFHAQRVVDSEIRQHQLHGVVQITMDVCKITAGRLSAVIAGIGEHSITEYRVSLMRKGEDAVINGMAWPIYGSIKSFEADERDSLIQIQQTLKSLGIRDVLVLDGIHKPESCEECGMPLFFDTASEAVHIEQDEHAELPPHQHYH
jgi:Protein of unknown function (DUF2863)